MMTLSDEERRRIEEEERFRAEARVRAEAEARRKVEANARIGLQRKRDSRLILVLLIVLAVIIIGSLLPESKDKPKPKEDPQKQAQHAAFNADLNALSQAGALAGASGDANRFDISGWNSSLDLYMGNRLTMKADSLAQFFCYQYFKQRFQTTNDWKIRVYLADGTVGAECTIR